MRCRSLWLSTMAVVSLLLAGRGWSWRKRQNAAGMLRVAYGNEIAHLDFHTARAMK